MSETDVKHEGSISKRTRTRIARALKVPAALTTKEAAAKLGLTHAQFRELTHAHMVITIMSEGRELVPPSEIERLSEVNPPKPLTKTELRVAEKLTRLTTPSGPAALQRLRSARSR